MRHFGRFFTLSVSFLISLFAISGRVQAQDAPCTPTELAVNFILPDGRLMRGLQRDNVIARVKQDNLKIDSMSYDTGPRRMVFVLDAGRDLPREAKKAESEVVSHIVSRAPADNSFGLITARGARAEVGFGEPREKFDAALTQLLEPAKSSPDELGGLDALMEALGWFESPLPGDAIVLMASGIENNKRVTYSTVTQALADHHIRLFSFLLGPMLAGTVYTNIGVDYRGHLSSSSTSVPNRENLSALTWNSGGYMVLENTKMPWKEYKLTDAHLDELRREGWRMYGAAAEFYRLLLVPVARSSRHEEWTLELAESIRKRFPQAKALYPRELPPCEARPK